MPVSLGTDLDLRRGVRGCLCPCPHACPDPWDSRDCVFGWWRSVGSASAWALLAELNKGAFFGLGLGASTARLEVKPPASEADGSRMGGVFQRAGKAVGLHWSPRGAATGHFQDERLGPSCSHSLAAGCWLARDDAWSLPSSHNAIVMPVVLPVCQATPSFTKYIWFCL